MFGNTSHEVSRNRYGDLGTLLLRSRLRFGEARTAMQTIARTSAHESFGSSIVVRMITQLDYFEVALDETMMVRVRRDGRWTAFAKAFHQD